MQNIHVDPAFFEKYHTFENSNKETFPGVTMNNTFWSNYGHCSKNMTSFVDYFALFIQKAKNIDNLFMSTAKNLK